MNFFQIDYEDNFQEEEDPLNSSLTPMDWLPRLNAKAGMVEVPQYLHQFIGLILGLLG